MEALFTFLASPAFSRKHLPSGVLLDTSRIAVSGESGGGYAARAAGIFAEPKPAAILLQYAMGGQFLDDHWLAVKDGPIAANFPNVTAEAFEQLLTQPQDPISYDPMPSLGDDAPNGDSRRSMLLLLWWQTGELLDYVLGVKISASLRKKPFNERAEAIPAALRKALLQTRLTSSFPPTFLCHGKDDSLILPAESEFTHQHLRDLNVESELHILDSAGHALMDVQSPGEVTHGAHDLRKKAFNFLIRNLL